VQGLETEQDTLRPEQRVGGEMAPVLPHDQTYFGAPKEEVRTHFVGPGEGGHTEELFEQMQNEAEVAFVLETMQPDFGPIDAAVQTRMSEYKRYKLLSSEYPLYEIGRAHV